MAAGIKTGGRKKGVLNKKTETERALKSALLADGVMPLEYLLGVMRDEPPKGLESRDLLAAHSLRFEAAKAAAPFCHAKLASVEVGNKAGEMFKVGLLSEDGGVL